MASVLTIILNWNCAKDTMEAIDSVMASETEPHGVDIFLVDNGSKDNSVEILRKYFTQKNYDVVDIKNVEDVKLEKKGTKKIFFYLSPKNLGFTGGNNLGFEFALKHGYEFVFLLNADAVVNKDTIKVLVESFTDEKIACVGPKVYAYNINGRKDYIVWAGTNLDLLLCKTKRRQGIDIGQYEEIWESADVQGCSMMISSSALKDVGKLDDILFAYREETDWCMRARKKGYRCLYIPKAKAWHKGEGVPITSTPPYKFELNARNLVIFAKKYGKIKIIAAIYLTIYYPIRLWCTVFQKTKNPHLAFSFSFAYVRGVKNGLMSFDRMLQL
ncbi:MAG: glycosyltransferase family 2 protein [Thermoplasmata archaeon]